MGEPNAGDEPPPPFSARSWVETRSCPLRLSIPVGRRSLSFVFGMLMRGKAITVWVGCILAAVILIALLLMRSGQSSAATVSFLGFTNSATGERIGLFRITNQLAIRIARNGYCRFGGHVVDVMPTMNLDPGDSHTVEVPLPGVLQEAEYRVTFNGVRDLGPIDNLFDLAGALLHDAGLNWRWPERRRWESTCEFKRDTEPDGAANGSQPTRSETNTTSSAAGSRR